MLKWRHRSCPLVSIRSPGYTELHFSFRYLGIYLSQESLNCEKGKGAYLERIPTCHSRVNLGQWRPRTLPPHPAHCHLCPTSLNVTMIPDFSWCLYNEMEFQRTVFLSMVRWFQSKNLTKNLSGSGWAVRLDDGCRSLPTELFYSILIYSHTINIHIFKYVYCFHYRWYIG